MNINRKPYTIYGMMLLSMTFSDLWPPFQGHDIFEVEYRKNKDKKTKLLLHNRKLYVTYGMVLCLVTLTDLQTCRAGLSASAQLLVK